MKLYIRGQLIGQYRCRERTCIIDFIQVQLKISITIMIRLLLNFTTISNVFNMFLILLDCHVYKMQLTINSR